MSGTNKLIVSMIEKKGRGESALTSALENANAIAKKKDDKKQSKKK